MPTSEYVPGELILELDPRAEPINGERVWFPDKDPTAKSGYVVVSGRVTETGRYYTEVKLNKHVPMQSQSGSPVISRDTGRVIGTVSRSLEMPFQTTLRLTPSAAILKVLAKNDEMPALKSVIGVQQPQDDD
jgi:hypothetical protein